jgi:eukaryotic-like serine/threonine-protein kinase
MDENATSPDDLTDLNAATREGVSPSRRSQPATALRAGTTLGSYTIERLLGQGGMGAVFLARDTTLRRQVAIKFLGDESDGTTSRPRLLREARNAAALNHSNICTIYEVGEADGAAFIAMEYVDGRSLRELIAEHPLSVEEVVSHGIEIADALAHAHSRQIVHRDLKSANVVATSDGRVKVLDFGLAKRIAADPHAETVVADRSIGDLTGAGVIAGTVAYMAPEQLRGGAVDARSDIWALGVVLYEMATGSLPFNGRSSFEVSSNILNERPAPFPRSIPVRLRETIEKCLEKDPGRRYQSAQDVSLALHDIPSRRSTMWSAVSYQIGRGNWVALAAAVVLIAAAIAGWRFVRRSNNAAPARVESIAVLPLQNLSGDIQQDYFTDGITEALSTDLARLTGLKRVIARGSVLQYKASTKPPEQIARELNVDALVTGSVLRSGNRLSVTAQLLNPVTGAQMWANRYERNLQDVLALRNEIVAEIVREIKAQLSPEERARLASAPTVNAEAFEAVLKGRFYWLRQTREDYDQAERYFQFALDKDPDYALAYAGLASVWLMRGDAGFMAPSEAFPKATTYLEKALALDDSLADLHVELATHNEAIDWDWPGAEREYRRAIELNPNHADAHFYYANELIELNRRDEWKREIERAQELDPLNDFQRGFYGWHLNFAGRYDEAIALLQRLLPTAPNVATVHLGLWGAYHRKGMYEQALTSARNYFVAAGDGEFANILRSGSDAATYRSAMKATGEAMVKRLPQRHIPALRIARMFAHAGDRDSAIAWLEKAYAARESPLTRLAVSWDWLDLHGDSRFQSLLRRMNLPQS